ncbi:MAG: hypothetical protein ACOX31_04820 [Eubacteriales bacterium]|jgi:energy-coupling factor transport system substrate-specific component
MRWFTQKGKTKDARKQAIPDRAAGSPGRALRYPRKLRDMAVFSMAGAMMFCSDLLLDALPNVHLIGMFTMLLTLTYRCRALIPIYIYVMLTALYYGFALSVVPYFYVWTVLWGMTMLLTRNISDLAAAFAYPLVCSLHGLIFGALCAPSQALLFGLNFSQMIAWIVAGLPFDLVHAAGNLAAGLLVLPLSKILKKISVS